MANDIIDINVYETVETVAITVNPNLTTVNINQVTGGGGGGATDLGYTPSPTNGTVTSSTGSGATIPLADGTNAGLFTPAEKTKLSGIASGAEVNVNADWNATSGDAQILNKPTISGSNTGDQNLQSVTNIGASTTNPININVTGVSNAITGQSSTGTGVVGISGTGKGIDAFSTTGIAVNGYSGAGIGVNGYSEEGVAGSFETDSISGNIANFKKAGSIVASVTNNGNINANAFVKSGGTSSQILAADGSVITAGTNITITGGQISSVGGTGGGGSSVNYYLNGGTSQGTFGGTTYYEFSKTAVIVTGADFNISSDGYIASFITDVADPSLLLIPAGNWNLEFFFSSSSAGGSPSFYVELYKYDGTTFTLIASNSTNPEGITNGTSIDAYFTPLTVPETILTVNDRLAIRVFVNASSKTITLHTQNGHLCEVITTFTAGLTALNGLQAQVQNFATGTTGTDFAINSSGSTHTFNLPSASATARGVVTTGSQTFAGTKTFSSNIVIPATGSELILSVGSGGTVNGLTTSTYASTFELTYLKGVTSAIQTQLNSKQATISLTTSGTSGAATLTGANLNIPQYGGATNLTYTASPTNGTVVSDTGTDATLPLADATNAGLLKPAKFTVLENTSGTNTGDQNLSGYALLASPTFTGTPSLPTGTTGTTQTPLNNSTRLATTAYVEAACAVVAGATGVQVSSQDTFGTNKIATVTAAQYAAFVTAGTVSATTLYFITV